MAIERLVVRSTDGLWAGRFDAMASPCELLVDGGDEASAQRLTALAQAEALRIEHKYSRYRADSELSRWHAHAAAHPGEPIALDDESAGLLDLAALCHGLSGGRFDISSGVLREVWRFDGSDRVPEPADVARVAARVGWQRVAWRRPWLTLPPDMALDLGGLGKEYAADRVLGQLRAQTDRPLLVNLGGDLVASGPREGGLPWYVGVEQAEAQTPQRASSTAPQAAPNASPEGAPAAGLIALRGGALATSGDARRYLLRAGVRYSHILDPRTGWPVQGAPRSVTVAAPTCTEAGLMATLAMLQGPGAEALLQAQGLPHWVQREGSSLPA
jgi:thiamine biosynthesis lipoprotein